VIVENVLLRDVQLPAMLKGSIEASSRLSKNALRMSFILQKRKQEAERKRIEAQGIADFQKIVAPGDQRAVVGVERHRSHRKTGDKRER